MVLYVSEIINKNFCSQYITFYNGETVCPFSGRKYFKYNLGWLFQRVTTPG
jgi:hypothetical protein